MSDTTDAADIKKAKAEAWEEGYEQCSADLFNDHFGDFISPNPYKENKNAR